VAHSALLTNHGLALLCIAENPRIRIRDIAATVGITERAAQRIVAELIEEGFVVRSRDGRRNRYAVRSDAPVTVPSKREVEVGALISALS
jgi:DNA-binding MarR family transcriptional regulator